MSVGKIDDLVSQDALNQLDELYKRLGITRNEMVSATEQAAKFTAALGDSKNLQDFSAAQAKASEAMQSVIANNTTIIAQQKEITIQTQAVTDAVKIKVAADANADAVLRQVSGSLDANIRQLVQQKLELKNVNDELKKLNSQYAGTQQSQAALQAKTAQLTQQQVQLKDAIASQNLIIRQQVKENNAAESSQDAMLAKLNLLRKSYNSLSEEERNNAQVGGVMLSRIRELSDATSKINETQGKYNDSVGKYEEKIKSAISAYVPYGRQINAAIDATKSLTTETEGAAGASEGMGAAFGAVAAGGVAILAVGIAAAAGYLSQFRDVIQSTEQKMGGLKNVWNEFGHSLLDGGALDVLKNFLAGNFTTAAAQLSTGISSSYTTGVDVTKAIQNVKNLNEVNDQLIAKQQAQADQYRAQAKNVGLAADERIAKLKQAETIETHIVDEQTQNAQKNIDAAIALSDKFKKLSPTDKKTLATGSEGAIRLANELAQNGKIVEAGYEMLMQGYQRQTQALNAANMKLIRQQNDEARIGLKDAKKLNTEELELLKAKLQGERDTAKLILDDQSQSYDVRLAQLKVYVARSNAIIDTENEIANRIPGISSTKKATNNQIAANQKTQVKAFDQNEQQKIALDAAKDFTRLINQLETQITDDIQENLNQRLLAVEKNNADESESLRAKYEKNLISEQEYNRRLKILNDKSNEERIKAELDAETAILGIQQGLNFSGFGNYTPKQVQSTKDKVTSLSIQYQRAQTATKSDQTRADDNLSLSAGEKAIGIIQEAGEAQQTAQELLNGMYDKQIQALETRSKLIDDAAKAEVNGINNSILSNKEKAREVNIINAQAATQQRALQEEQNKIKHRQAVTDKALAAANVIENTAVAAIKAPAELGPIFGIAAIPIVLAIGAAQLASVLSAPIPQFYKGTKNAPEGFAHVGERGTELQINPDGRLELTPNTDTVKYLQKGTQIIPNHELIAMLGKPEPINYIGGTYVDNRKLEKLLEENNQLQRRKQPVNVHVHTDKFGTTYANRNY